MEILVKNENLTKTTIDSRGEFLTLNNVSYKYIGTKKKVLNDISATFEPGRIYTIIGKSGSGVILDRKSTRLNSSHT